MIPFLEERNGIFFGMLQDLQCRIDPLEKIKGDQAWEKPGFTFSFL
jgi:hypothetical protein